MDLGHKRTDAMLQDMEKRIQKVYAQAARETQQKVKQHYSSFADKYAKKVSDLNKGKITKAEFRTWAHDQMMTGKRWQEMENTIAKDLTNADKLAASMMRGYLPDVYALNHNYGTYEIEHGIKVDTSYTLYDRQTVERLLRDNPDLIPQPKVDTKKDIRWNKQRFNSGITQGILQGESIPAIAKRVALGTAHSDYVAALRNARTATTGAENAGRIDSYERAAEMGIKVKKIWMATLDSRTRDSHRDMDGEEQDYNEEFSNGLMYPGDFGGSSVDPSEVWNCRCTLVADTEGNADLSDIGTRNNDLGGMSYDEWKEEHEQNGYGADANTSPTAGGILRRTGLQYINEKGLQSQSSASLRKGTKNLQKKIKEHKGKIRNPKAVYTDWEDMPEKWQRGVLSHWKKEISNFEQSIKNRKLELRKRGRRR